MSDDIEKACREYLQTQGCNPDGCPHAVSKEGPIANERWLPALTAFVREQVERAVHNAGGLREYNLLRDRIASLEQADAASTEVRVSLLSRIAALEAALEKADDLSENIERARMAGHSCPEWIVLPRNAAYRDARAKTRTP